MSAPRADERPHSQACGWWNHPHGADCATDCPTCRKPSTLPPGGSGISGGVQVTDEKMAARSSWIRHRQAISGVLEGGQSEWELALMDDLQRHRAAAKAVKALAEKWENATNLGDGRPSIVTKAFAAELRKALRGEWCDRLQHPGQAHGEVQGDAVKVGYITMDG